MRSGWIDIDVIIVAGAMLLSGCLAPEEPCGVEGCGSISSSVIDFCESFGCGGNAEIEDTEIHELHSGEGGNDGSPNAHGFVIERFVSGAGAAPRLPVRTPMVLHVEGDDVQGLVAGQDPVRDEELVGAAIELRRVSGESQAVTSASLQILGTGTIDFWVGGAEGPSHARFFHLAQVGSSRAPMPLCPTPWGSDPDDVSYHPVDGMAFLFAGDRYDPTSVTVEVPGAPGWFNIACTRTALAKMHLLRHTSAGSGSAESPSREQRQAMLKLLSADYCGDGRAYARNGTPLFFQDPDGLFDPTPRWGDRAGAVESIWTSDGALCLDDPRLPFPGQTHADVRAEIVSACETSKVDSRRRTIPRCTAEQLKYWRSFGPISRNVSPPIDEP